MKKVIKLLSAIFIFAVLFSCSKDEIKQSTTQIPNPELSKVIQQNILKINGLDKITNISKISLETNKGGTQYLYFTAIEDGVTKIFAQSFNEHIDNINLLSMNKYYTGSGTTHSCSGCTTCRFKYNEAGGITGCLKWGNCSCIHTITTTQP